MQEGSFPGYFGGNYENRSDYCCGSHALRGGGNNGLYFVVDRLVGELCGKSPENERPGDLTSDLIVIP